MKKTDFTVIKSNLKTYTKNFLIKLENSKFLNNGKKRKRVAITLATVLIFLCISSVFTALINGERTNIKKAVKEYNNSVPDTSYLYCGISKSEVSTELNNLDLLLNETLAEADITSLIFSDEGATAVGKLLGHCTDTKLKDIEFNTLKKEFPDAYNYIISQIKAGKNWSELDIIPFGIEEGNEKDFITACGAIGEFFGNNMISMFLKAPSVYNDALVPALESLQTGPMPSLSSFILQTGLSGSRRVEFIMEKIVTILRPLQKAPLTYLCSILPDFIINYEKSCDFINGSDLGIELPEIEDILNEIFSALGMENEKLDLDYLSSLGTASEAKSGGNNGKRMQIEGDREAIFLYISEYILKHITYNNNFTAIEEIFSHKLKQISVDSLIGSLLTNEKTNKIIAKIINILAMNSFKQETRDASTIANEFNSQNKDFSYIFDGYMSEESVGANIDSIDSVIIDFISGEKLEGILFTDKVATIISKLTAKLCNKELSDISFAALETSFPDAYEYISSLKAEGKTWDDVETIPFGIEKGNKEMFIKACGAGAEHFGDVLALSIMIAPTAYEEALMPLLESLHTGAMPNLEEFIGMQGLDSAKRMEIITEKVLTILEPLKESPITYLCRILPDLIYSYNIASTCYENYPDLEKTGLVLKPLDQLLNEIFSSIGVVLPDYNFDNLINLSSAKVAESGDRTAERVELTGDREAVFACLATYIAKVIDYEDNLNSISQFLSEISGINASVIKAVITSIRRTIA